MSKAWEQQKRCRELDQREYELKQKERQLQANALRQARDTIWLLAMCQCAVSVSLTFGIIWLSIC